MSLASGTPVQNHLLASLPHGVMERLRHKLTPIDLPLRMTLHRPGAPLDAVYFVETGMISLVANLDEGTQAEVGIIGAEGVLGTTLLAGVDTPFSESMVQMPGSALRLTARDFRREIAEDGPLRAVMLRYNEALMAQVMQTAACNGRHALEQRFARWLLMAHDRAESDTLPLTQEFMAMMLGVHRPSITVIAGVLQRAGIIRYAAGRVTIVERAVLEEASCECYETVRLRYEALLPMHTE